MTTIFGTNGNDTLAALDDGDTVLGLKGQDLLTTSLNNTELDGGDGDDHLIATNDVHFGQADVGLTFVQFLDGGICNDHITVNTTADVQSDSTVDANAGFIAYIAGDTGHDVINVTMAVTGSTGSGGFGAGALVAGGSGNDQINVDLSASNAIGSGAAIAYVSGDIGSDTINVSLSAEGEFNTSCQAFIDAGSGNDTVTVAMSGPTSVAEIYAGSGNDSVTVTTTGDAGSAVGISVAGEGGNDTITVEIDAGQVGGGFLDGGGGSDKLSVSGGTGSTLAGGAGSDRLTGSSAADVFQFGSETTDGAVTKDWITNYSAAQGDVLDLPGGIADVATWNVVGNSTQLHLTGDGDLIILKNYVVHDLATDVLFV